MPHPRRMAGNEDGPSETCDDEEDSRSSFSLDRGGNRGTSAQQLPAAAAAARVLPDSVSVLADTAGTNGRGQGVLVGTAACSPPDGMAGVKETATKETTTTTNTAVVQRGSIDDTATTSGPAWQQRYNQLVSFQKQYGHCHVPHNKEWAPLARWVYRQKRRRAGPYLTCRQLNKKEIAQLESIGIDWTIQKVSCWDERFQTLVNFQRENGHCRVPRWHALFQWLHIQRHRRFGPYHGKQLTSDQISKLEFLGVLWPNQQDEARDDDPTATAQPISVATKRKATAEESESNVSHNQDDVLASPHCVGACNSLNKRARLDSSSSNGGDAAPADEQMFACHVYAVQTDKSSQGIGSVHLCAQSTFTDARLAILEKMAASPLLPAHEPWNFHIPPTGRKIQKSLESSLGPLRSFLRKKAPTTVMKQGDVQLLCLSERVHLDIIRRSISGRNNGGEAMIRHTNEQWFAGRIHVIQADNQSVLEENEFILLSSQSTFADARRAIAQKTSTSPLLPAQQWQFHIPPLGNITDEEQEPAFGPLRSYLQRFSPWTVSEKGDVELFLFVL